MISALEAKEFPYDNAVLPEREENLPPSLVLGSVEHCLFLFASCYYMRGGIESETAFVKLGKMFQSDPGLFNTQTFMNGSSNEELEARVLKRLVEAGLGYNKTTVPGFWRKNSQKIGKHWGGDPRNFFDNLPKRESHRFYALCTILKNQGANRPESKNGFYGFQEKMVSMIIYFLASSKLIDDHLVPVPIDFHALRIMIAHDLLEVRGSEIEEGLYSKELLRKARELSVWYCKNRGVSSLTLCQALWLLSGAICDGHPGNRSTHGKPNGRSTIITPESVAWNPSQINGYHRSCGRCPVSQTCNHCVPAAPYYVQGKLQRRGRRERLWFEGEC